MTSWFEQYKVDVPEGRSGAWAIEHFEITEKEAKFSQLRAAINTSGRGRSVTAGTYTNLVHYITSDQGLVSHVVTIMSDTEAEIRDHLRVIYKAKGHVLIHGLGIGMVAKACLSKPEVESVTVVELQPDVIKLVGPWLEGLAAKANKRLTIIQGDAFTWKPPKEQKWDIVWHDVWNEICTDNLPQMSKLHRRFGKRCSWQDSWSRELLQVYRREERKQEKALEMWR